MRRSGAIAGLSFLSYSGGTECGAAGLYPAGLSFLSYTQEALNEQQGFPAGLFLPELVFLRIFAVQSVSAWLDSEDGGRD